MNPYFTSFHEYLHRLGLSEDIIREIMQCYLVKTYKKEEYFASVDERSDKLGFVVNGLFYMYTIKQDGTFFTKDFITKEQFLLAAYGPENGSTVNIKAIKASVILEAKYSDIRKLLDKYHEIEVLSKKRTEKELEAICQKMAQYATMTAKDRYIMFKEKFAVYEEKIPQYLIASYLGITPTQLSRIRNRLKN